MKKIKKFRVSALLLLLSGLLVLAGCGAKGEASSSSGTPEKELLKLKIADTGTNPVFRLALAKGFFKNNGIDAEIVNFGTPAEGVNALFIKQVDVAYGADFPLLNAVAKGDYSIIASAGQATDEAAAQWKLFVRDDIKKPEDLKGKKLSFLRGTFLPYLWDEYLKDAGVSLADATLVGQGAFDEAFIALKQGDVDAAWFTGSALVDKFEGLAGVHQLSDMSKTKVRLGMGIVTNDALVKEHPEAVEGFLKAVDEAAVYSQAHPEETADLMYKELKQPKEATLKDLPKNPWKVGFTQAAFDSLESQKKYMVESGIIEKDFDLASKISLDPLRKALPDKVTYNK
ncbi:NitT/TauT family transport system substrate-binding protein [Paenibacillus forsythiae]|uniref:NitT/TauT family transport system substrate-binding protein n=1 Tax=Paenibacillus forsythiae TaxID=365616 RepID=A0ABU3H8T6_9BACL|nr:ABC transporter substrate-binding protein [Paenibacillus forsythiae]MDT3427240.1 NitT/TauT family transport system substrate-binding protein [Paenibacillus forsythiae]